MRRKLIVVGVALLAVSACGRGEPNLINFRSDTPDEFSVLPSKPLQQPETFAALPQPTPGGANRTDPTPEADAFVALGGNPAALNRPSGDGAIVNYAGRYGVARNIRGELAAQDLQYRRDNRGRLLERWFNQTTYYSAYAPQELNQHAELERFRRAGIRTPAAPPEGIE